MMEAIASTFNGPVEMGTRCALILTAIGKQFSLEDLVLLDYALIYSKDFGGPGNLHPALPNHIAEIGLRREIFPSALLYFVKRSLIEMQIKNTGYFYSSSKQTLHFISCLKSNYYKKTWVRLSWLNDFHQSVLDHSFPKYKV